MKTLNVEEAEKIAREKHRTQRDKNGDPYILHPMRVAASLHTQDQKIVAILHDVLEDTDTTAEELLACGATQEQLQALLLLTHAKEEPYLTYLARVKHNPLALAVKLADLADNSNPERLAKLPVQMAERLRLKYETAYSFLLGPNCTAEKPGTNIPVSEGQK